MHHDIIILGGGASGVFTAIQIAEMNSKLRPLILERSKTLLNKVKISGGGRCNVTHAEFIPQDLIKNYPRGERELLGPFHQFMTGDMMAWLEKNQVALKIEEDGRIFPTSDDSQSIIDCFLSALNRYRIPVQTQEAATRLSFENNLWQIKTSRNTYTCKKIVVATGSSPKIWELLSSLNLKIVPPVPSLFTFNVKDNRILNLAGLSTQAHIKLRDFPLDAYGPLLITHWGLSGPAVLKLSAWGARHLHVKNYQFVIEVNWLENSSTSSCLELLLSKKQVLGKQKVHTHSVVDIPKRLWQSLVAYCQIDKECSWAEITKKELNTLAQCLTASQFNIQGKSTFKDEFVTAGGVELKTVNFKSMESKTHKNMYFTGEVLNIDAITGGFNFQNAWTTAYIAAKHIAHES